MESLQRPGSNRWGVIRNGWILTVLRWIPRPIELRGYRLGICNLGMSKWRIWITCKLNFILAEGWGWWEMPGDSSGLGRYLWDVVGQKSSLRRCSTCPGREKRPGQRRPTLPTCHAPDYYLFDPGQTPALAHKTLLEMFSVSLSHALPCHYSLP